VGILLSLFGEFILILWAANLYKDIKTQEYHETDAAFYIEYDKALWCLLEFSTDDEVVEKIMSDINTREQAIALRLKLEAILKKFEN
jgi:hypothetical protein